MVQTPTRKITLKEFLQLPETKPYCEYSDDQIIQKSMPQGQHSTINSYSWLYRLSKIRFFAN